MINGKQCRMARGALNWSKPELARAAGLHANSIQKFENGSVDVRISTMQALMAVFAEHGIEFVDADTVRYRERSAERLAA